jgi:ubiquitin C-terminal hydrolase
MKESELAFQSWKTYTKRNQSIIVDLMQGQCKSLVICPKCKFNSITFDSFTTVSLPMPRKLMIKYMIISKNHNSVNKLMGFITNKFNIIEWRSKAAELLKKKPQ